MKKKFKVGDIIQRTDSNHYALVASYKDDRMDVIFFSDLSLPCYYIMTPAMKECWRKVE